MKSCKNIISHDSLASPSSHTLSLLRTELKFYEPPLDALAGGRGGNPRTISRPLLPLPFLEKHTSLFSFLFVYFVFLLSPCYFTTEMMKTMVGSWILMATVLMMAVSLNTVTCSSEEVEVVEGAIAHGAEHVVVETNATATSSSSSSKNVTIITTTVNPNITTTPATAVPLTNSTDPTEEKPITETIRTYIEDSVKSVKHAISKIGKFVGEFFEDTPSNSTVPANASTTVSHGSTVANGTTIIPPTSSPVTQEPHKK